MAKGKNRGRKTRDHPEVANQVRLRSRPNLDPYRLEALVTIALNEIDDARRTRNLPLTEQKPRTVSGYPAKTVTGTFKHLRGALRPPAPLSAVRESFSTPMDTVQCVRRRVRKEVLHAFKKTGKGGQRRPRRNQWSHIKC